MPCSHYATLCHQAESLEDCGVFSVADCSTWSPNNILDQNLRREVRQEMQYERMQHAE